MQQQNIDRYTNDELQEFEVTTTWEVFELGTLSVSGTGKLEIFNTGGSSAGEGGMGSGSDDDREKGELGKAGEKGGNAVPGEETDEGWDPIKKSIKEAEREHKKD
jgi:hypothetical protein